MFGVNVCVHGHGVGCEESCGRWQWAELVKIVKYLIRVFRVAGAEIDNFCKFII
jgi:hypothetical protein